LEQQFYLALWTGPDYIESGPAVEGSIIIDVVLDLENPKAASLLNTYNEKFGQDPTYPLVAATSYDALHILADAIGEYGEDTDKIRDYLYDLPNYSGTFGDYRFNDDGDIVGASFILKQVRNQEVVDYEQFE